ncbi:hypothetical protein [Nesterenkonia sp. NBAIMH1]|uniref:hypothetical protein n=1 Tax=Nesterenkonia sp. NBAIMH1 TaxID=2600320 RepID=UPI0011B7BF52|nr:hypothetical protein [Nesterenkonia sp. NBAIMH1]
MRKVSVAGGCTVRTAALGELTPDDFQRWRRLDARALEPVPYLSADYLQPGSAHWPAAASVRLLLVERDDEMQMVMPFRIMPLHPWLPFPSCPRGTSHWLMRRPGSFPS